MTDGDYRDYPIFRGIQRPLEFMSIQGRYIYWAAATAGAAIIGFILGYCLVGFLTGLIVLVTALSTGAALIFIKQQKGLHSKHIDKGVFTMARTIRM